MQTIDSIIIGAGHNGLVCAAYLARSGQKVLVLEANSSVGGLAASREFHPGFSCSVAQTLTHFSTTVAGELELEKHGYRTNAQAMTTTALCADGNHVSFHGDVVVGVSEQDSQRYQEYRRLLSRCAAALAPSWDKTMPGIGDNSFSELMTFAQVGLKLRLLGKDDMREFFRIAALPARDLMDENFDSELLKAALSWDGLVGSTQAPRSPNNTVLPMLLRMTGAHGGDHSLPVGGMQSLVSALQGSATAAGAEIRCSSPVQSILLDESGDTPRASGVVLEDGSELHAARVISATDPKSTFLKLLGAKHLEIGFGNRVHRLRSNGHVAKLHLALSDLPTFKGMPQPDGRLIIAPDMDSIEFAWDDAKYKQCPDKPVMEIVVPSLADASLAPNGQHVLSANVMYIPHTIKGGWTDEARSGLLESLLSTLESYAPGLRQLVLHSELLTPADLEAGWHIHGGHWHHGEWAMDQMLMMRPTYEAAQYATPIPGLHLCSAGCHPGGGLMGACGRNAAREIAKL